MKFTVLGASGFVGRHLVNALHGEGHDVFAPEKGSPDIFERPLGHVIYCIGLTADFRTRPFDTMRAHVAVLSDVLEKADFDSLLYLSSTRVYGRSEVGSEASMITVDVSAPSDLYNISKLAGESLCLSCGRPSVRIARVSNIVGNDLTSDNFIFTLVRESLTGRIKLQSALSSAKDYILLDDVVALLTRIAAGGSERIYNVASGSNITHQEITDRLVASTGCELVIGIDAVSQNFPTIDVTRITKEFDFRPGSVLDALPVLFTYINPT